MHRMTRFVLVLMLPMAINLGCDGAAPHDKPSPPPKSSNPVPIPDPVTATKGEASGTAPGKTQPAEQLAISPSLLQSIDNGTPKDKRNAGKLLGELLQESRRRSLTKPAETRADRASLQVEILKNLGRLGSLAIEAEPVLAAILDNAETPELKLQVLELLPKLGSTGKRLGPEIAHASRDPKLKSSAIQALIQLGCQDSTSVAAFGEALRDKELRDQSLVILGQLEGPVVTPASRFLVELATSREAPVPDRIAAIEIIAKINRSGIPELFYDKDLVIRKAVARTGAFNGSQLAIEKDPEVIDAAFEGLARPPIDPVRLAGVFDQALKSETLRPKVKQFLDQHSEQVVGTLMTLFKSDTAMIRESSIDLLAELEISPPVTASLNELLHNSDDPGLIALAAIKLGQVAEDLDPTEFAEIVGKWISHSKLKSQALALLSKLGAPAIPVLAESLLDNQLDSAFRARVLETLTVQPDAASIAQPIILAALRESSDEDITTRQWAALTLLRLVRKDSDELLSNILPDVKTSLKSTDVILLRLTLEALSEQPKLAAGLDAEIQTTLTHTEPAIRIAAIKCITLGGVSSISPAALETIQKLATDDPDPEVKKQAAKAVK